MRTRANFCGRQGGGVSLFAPSLGSRPLNHALILRRQSRWRQPKSAPSREPLEAPVPNVLAPKVRGNPRCKAGSRRTGSDAALRLANPSGPARQLTEVAKLIDVSKCIGCKAC